MYLRSKITLIIIFLSQVALAQTEFYKIQDVETYQQEFVKVESRNGIEYEVSSHHYSNGNQDLVVVVHGYLDNCGFMKPINSWFLKSGFDVYCIELPGHGDSSGQRAGIDKVESYQNILAAGIRAVELKKYRDYYFLAHSAGSLGMTEYLLANKSHPFKKIFMIAPLVKSYMWNLSWLGYRLTSRFISYLPRRRDAINNREYKKLSQLDSKPIRKVPMNWFKQLVSWNYRLLRPERYSDEKIVLFFLGKDTVINNKFNQYFYQKYFPQSKKYYFPKSRHNIHFEEVGIRSSFFELLKRELNANSM